MNHIDAPYNSINGLSGLKQAQVTKETPLTRLSSAIERLRKAEGVVSATANKLVGSWPDEACSTEVAPIRDGVFGSIEEMADEASRLASDIIGHIERVERRL